MFLNFRFSKVLRPVKMYPVPKQYFQTIYFPRYFFLLAFIQGSDLNGKVGTTFQFRDFDSGVVDLDPGCGVYLTPGSGTEKIRIRDEHPRSFFRELRSSFLG
jgi:hypothetical protein